MTPYSSPYTLVVCAVRISFPVGVGRLARRACARVHFLARSGRRPLVEMDESEAGSEACGEAVTICRGESVVWVLAHGNVPKMGTPTPADKRRPRVSESEWENFLLFFQSAEGFGHTPGCPMTRVPIGNAKTHAWDLLRDVSCVWEGSIRTS